ncbi:mismatch-specific DNA-glycosylase [Pollutimonas sp. H1-120]|uniref:mismatch-specific DNA-glycosylase n=1 Tax=Pollutimonas sp. H1-120 TaxID=3148824 RepID=UPI003B520E3F
MATEPPPFTALAPRLPDIVTGGLAVVFCGLNPGLSAATSGHHFANKSNRFWKTLYLAGFTPERIDPANDSQILQYGCGLTVVVDRPTARANEVSRQEFQASQGVMTQQNLLRLCG